MSNRTFTRCAAMLGTLLSAAAAEAIPVQITATADNHYAVYTGDTAGTALTLIGHNELGRTGAPGAYNWSLAETFTFDSDDVFLYVAAWGDGAVTQGFVAELEVDGLDVLSGDPRWQVFGTGVSMSDGSPVPTAAAVGAQVASANTSDLWESPATGGQNGVAPWGTIAGVDSDAQWMWRGAPAQGSEAAQTYNSNEYIVFRLQIGESVPEPATLALLLLAPMIPALHRRG